MSPNINPVLEHTEMVIDVGILGKVDILRDANKHIGGVVGVTA
jgi:hypothetical protein